MKKEDDRLIAGAATEDGGQGLPIKGTGDRPTAGDGGRGFFVDTQNDGAGGGRQGAVPAPGWSWKRCQDCGAVFCGGPLARFCLDCRKAHVAKSSKARRLCDIGARARWGGRGNRD